MATPNFSTLTQKSDNKIYDPIDWMVAWFVLGLILFVATRVRTVYVISYYFFAFLITFLILTNYQFFVHTLAPFGTLNPGFAPSSDEQGTAGISFTSPADQLYSSEILTSLPTDKTSI